MQWCHHDVNIDFGMRKKRTQIYLEPELHRLLKEKAKEEGISLAELFRRMAKEYLRKGLSWDDFLVITKLGRSGKEDVSQKHDGYLAKALEDDLR